MGNADYSYAFVLKALRPVLDRIGAWEVVEQPESSLSLPRREGKGRRIDAGSLLPASPA